MSLTATDGVSAYNQALKYAKNSALSMATAAATKTRRICLRRKTSALYYDWNIVRYCSDFSHLGALIAMLMYVFISNSCAGISLRMHILLLIVAIAHLSNVFLCTQGWYLHMYKTSMIFLSVAAVSVVVRNRETYQYEKDTCSMFVLLFPALVGTAVFTDYGSAVGFLWNLSFVLEAIAPLPQYIMCYRASYDQHQQLASPLFTTYLLGIFGYRALLGAMWIFEIAFDMFMVQARVFDMISVSSGAIQLIFFIDFLILLQFGKSVFRSITLGVDNIISEAFARLEKMLNVSSIDPLLSCCLRVGGERSTPAFSKGDVEKAKIELQQLVGKEQDSANARAAAAINAAVGTPSASTTTTQTGASLSAAAAAIAAAAEGDGPAPSSAKPSGGAVAAAEAAAAIAAAASGEANTDGPLLSVGPTTRSNSAAAAAAAIAAAAGGNDAGRSPLE